MPSFCKDCGKDVTDSYAHTCVPKAAVAVPMARRSAKEAIDDVRTTLGIERGPRPIKVGCVCGHPKYHHSFDQGFKACVDCKGKCVGFREGGEA